MYITYVYTVYYLVCTVNIYIYVYHTHIATTTNIDRKVGPISCIPSWKHCAIFFEVMITIYIYLLLILLLVVIIVILYYIVSYTVYTYG